MIAYLVSGLALALLVAVLLWRHERAERCTRYVPITSPCAGIGGPRSRIVAGRVAVPALATCRAGLDAERELRTVESAGTQGVYLKATEGGTYQDRTFKDRHRAACGEGLLVGA